LLEWSRKAYEWGRDQCVPLIGFFQEWIQKKPFRTAETCCVSDMISIALKLTDAGAGDYWDDVDRYVRNQFAEGQLVNADRVYKYSAGLPTTPVRPQDSAYRVIERNVGGFCSYLSANDLAHPNKEIAPTVGIMQCCTGSGSRTLYYIWEHILNYADGVLKLNLLLNRASEWVDVHSHIPYTGKVEIKVKQPIRSLMVRMPEWIENGSAEVKASVNAEPRNLTWSGRYVDLGQVEKRDLVQVTFPISTRTVKETIGGQEVELTIKGTTVVEVSPPGPYCPIYQRQHLNADSAPLRPVQRFVSSEQVNW